MAILEEDSVMPTFASRRLGNVSTGHITPKDDALLREAAKDELASALGGAGGEHPQMVCAYYGGYIVSCWYDGTDEGYEELYKKLKEMGHSPSYINIIRVAAKQGLHCIQIDTDADLYDWLPVHDWNDK